ncbi:MAG: TetR/AcrR family transcriptional regulator [Candidatus Limnocylindrus sp.]
MKSSTRVAKGKIVVESGAQLTPDDFPLGNWIPGRRRVPSQERSLRTRKQILAAAETLAKSEGVGNITMQMIASKAKIAAGTAYQFFDDRDAIFAEIYEEWARTWWPTLIKATGYPLNESNWREGIQDPTAKMGKFYLDASSRWDIVTYIHSTKEGRNAVRELLEGNINRFVAWIGPLFRARGYSAAETRAICALLVRTIRGHWVYGVHSPSEMRELARAAADGACSIVDVKLTRASRPRPVIGKNA